MTREAEGLEYYAVGPNGWMSLPETWEEAQGLFAKIERFVGEHFLVVLLVVEPDAYDGPPENAVFHPQTWADVVSNETGEIVASYRDLEEAATACTRAMIEGSHGWCYVRAHRRALGVLGDEAEELEG